MDTGRMINKTLQLNPKLFDTDVEMMASRDGYGQGLVEAGEAGGNVMVLCADLAESTRSNLFKEKFPDRFIEIGVAEQNLVTVASGMANYGKIPFCSSFAVFSPGRNWEQIRTTIAINDVPVKIAGSHAGVTVGEDGATHQALEDIAFMRVLPNMTVIVPCDFEETKKATLAAATNGKPTYIRFGRPKTAEITTSETPFEIGKALTLWESDSPQVAIIACGLLIYEALKAARQLEKEGVGSMVINNHTIKPMDEETIIAAAKKCGAVVTVEEHQIAGGMGSAVAEVLAKNYPVPMEFVGMDDQFGESGKSEELLAKFKMTEVDIVDAVKKVIGRK